jgi:hypothetical protein
MNREINELSPTEINEILYLSGQSNGRRRLITNIYNISTQTLMEILIKYSYSTIMEKVEADYS